MIREVLFGDLFLHWRFVSRTHCGKYTISAVGQIVPCLLLLSCICNDANTWSWSAGACAGSGDEMVPCLALVEKISDNPVHFIASEHDLFPPSHKLGTRTEPMNTANYHICKHAHLRKWSRYLHSKILTSAPGPASAPASALLWDSVATNPKRWPPAVCQIQERALVVLNRVHLDSQQPYWPWRHQELKLWIEIELWGQHQVRGAVSGIGCKVGNGEQSPSSVFWLQPLSVC